MTFRHRSLASAAALVLAAGVAACGSSSGSSGSSTARTVNAATVNNAAATGRTPFAAAVAATSKPPATWPGPSAAVKPAAGKKIVVITCSSQGAGCVSAAAGATAAGTQLGWSVQTVDGKGDPQTWNSAILNAISEHADGIVLDAVPPALVGDGITKAHAAGIPLVAVFDPRLGPSGDVFSYVTPDHTAQGVAMADWVAADSGGKAQVILVEDNEFPELRQRVAGFQQELAKCSTCKILTTVQSQIGTMAQKLPQAIVSALQSNPGATYVISPYDSNALFASEGVQQAGRTTAVKVGGYEGDPSAIAAIRAGHIQAATIADPTAWMGCQAIYELTRAFAHQAEVNVPTRWMLVTKSNVPAGSRWTGGLDYASQFRKLWGVG